MPQIRDIVAVAYCDRFSKNKEVKIGRITEIVIPDGCEDIEMYRRFRISILSGQKTSTILSERSRFKTLQEMQEFE